MTRLFFFLLFLSLLLDLLLSLGLFSSGSFLFLLLFDSSRCLRLWLFSSRGASQGRVVLLRLLEFLLELPRVYESVSIGSDVQKD